MNLFNILRSSTFYLIYPATVCAKVGIGFSETTPAAQTAACIVQDASACRTSDFPITSPTEFH